MTERTTIGAYFKVLRTDLTSLGLLGARRMQYRMHKWMTPGERLSRHPRKGGGLWVVKNKNDAKRIKKYMARKHGVTTRIFLCEIGRILHSTSYRVKTDRLRLGQEIRPI